MMLYAWSVFSRADDCCLQAGRALCTGHALRSKSTPPTPPTILTAFLIILGISIAFLYEVIHYSLFN